MSGSPLRGAGSPPGETEGYTSDFRGCTPPALRATSPEGEALLRYWADISPWGKVAFQAILPLPLGLSSRRHMVPYGCLVQSGGGTAARR